MHRPALYLVLVVAAGCSKSNTINTNNTTTNVFNVGASGQRVTSDGGMIVNIPPGALTTEVMLSISELQAPAVPPLPGGFEARSPFFSVEPLDQSFALDVTIQVPHTGPGSVANRYLLRASPGTGWTEAPIDFSSATRIQARTRTLSYFVVAESGIARPDFGTFTLYGEEHPTDCPRDPAACWPQFGPDHFSIDIEDNSPSTLKLLDLKDARTDPVAGDDLIFHFAFCVPAGCLLELDSFFRGMQLPNAPQGVAMCNGVTSLDAVGSVTATLTPHVEWLVPRDAVDAQGFFVVQSSAADGGNHLLLDIKATIVEPGPIMAPPFEPAAGEARITARWINYGPNADFQNRLPEVCN